MAKRKKKKQPIELFCPYCGRPALFRPSPYVYGEDCVEPDSFVYVCSGFPDKCDAYVRAHAHNLRPKGIMADKELRYLRIVAHRALDSVWKGGWMTRNETYAWLANKMGLREKEMHIGYFSYYYCQEVIRICQAFVEERKKLEKEREKKQTA